MPVALHETADECVFTPWSGSPVPAERQIRGLHAVRLWERDLAAAPAFLTGVLGFVDLGQEKEWTGFGIEGGASGRYLEIQEIPDADRGRWGIGGVQLGEHLVLPPWLEAHRKEIESQLPAIHSPASHPVTG